MNRFSAFIWLSMAGVLIELSNGTFPLLTIKKATMFTADKMIEIHNNSNYSLPPYFSELEFECNSSYPTEWLFSQNPYNDENLREIPKITKTRLPVNDEYDTMKFGPFLFSSTVLLSFKKTDYILNFTCQEVNGSKKMHKNLLRNSKVLVQEPNSKTHHFSIIIKNGTDPPRNDSDHDDDANENDGCEKNKIEKKRFGANRHCQLSIHISTFQKKYACRSIMRGIQLRSKIIECHNPDECRSIHRSSSCDKNGEIQVVDEDPCPNQETDCRTFIPNLKPGIIVCSDGTRGGDLAIKYQLGKHQKRIVLDLKENERKGSELLNFETLKDDKGEMPVVYYSDQEYQFVCKASMYTFTHGIQWFLQKSNHPDGIFLRMIHGAIERRDESTQFYTSTVNVTFNKSHSEEQLLSCAAPHWNKRKEATIITINVTVVESYEPNITLYHNKTDGKLRCKVWAKPVATISWTRIHKGDKSNTSISGEDERSGEEDDTIISAMAVEPYRDKEVTYTCASTNFKGNSTKTITLPISKYSDSKDMLIIYLLSIIGGVFILSLIFLIFKLKKQKVQELSEADIEEFEKGISDSSNNNPILLPYNVKFEIPKESLTMDGGILGSGYFGTVSKGIFGTTVVAIKTVKKSADVMHFKALLSELKIMCHIGNHPHLVNLVGACTNNIRKQELYIVVEFCCNGNLLKLLRNSRNTYVDHYSTDSDNSRQSTVHYINADGKKLSTKDVVRWSAEIASGMEFLGTNNVVHGDLAARNVLISENMTAKLCDFGLSKQLCDYTVYVQKPQKPLPLKWMALESLRDLEFSLESDIWSYGITIWEVFSLGQSPYPGLQWDYNSWNLLEGGYRMLKPEFCNENIYKLMLRCWDKRPTSRISFAHLRIAFENELNELHIHTDNAQGLLLH